MSMPDAPQDATLLLHAYADGEIDAATALEIERRLADEPALAAEYARIRSVKTALSRLPREFAPDRLRARVEGLVVHESPVPVSVPAAIRPARWQWRQLAAGVLIGAFLAGGAGIFSDRMRGGDLLVENAVSNHRRALLAASPVDVASSDRHTVRPWFETKLALSVPAVDLADKGFPLVGGRIDMARDTPAATLVYRAREHLISLTVLAAQAGAPAGEGIQRSSLNGFSAWQWRDGGRVYCVVSDVEEADLAAFVAAFRASGLNR